MNKYITGVLIGIVICFVGLGLLIYQTLITTSVDWNVGSLPAVGVLYAFIAAVGLIVAIAMFGLNSKNVTSKK
jgi:hypothetical protein